MGLTQQSTTKHMVRNLAPASQDLAGSLLLALANSALKQLMQPLVLLLVAQSLSGLAQLVEVIALPLKIMILISLPLSMELANVINNSFGAQ
jgi:hypothetical protein